MSRTIIHLGLAITCAALVWAVYSQNQRLAALREKQQYLLANFSGPVTAANPDNNTEAKPAPTGVSPELLRLRSEVTRLGAEIRRLAGVRVQNARLREQLTERASRPAASPMAPPPPGAIAKENARFVGYNTPEDAIQSAFWAVQNQDVPHLLQSFTPEMARDISNNAAQVLFESKDKVPWIRILGRTPMPDGSFEVTIETPSSQEPEKNRLYQTNGQWRIGAPAD